VNLYLGMSAFVDRHTLCQKWSRYKTEFSDPQGADFRCSSCFSSGVYCLIGRLKRLSRTSQENFACFSQSDMISAPVKQQRSNLLLQITDLPAERRFGDVQAFSGFAKAEFLSDDHEVTQMAQLH
jgi:hypothetical protein